MKQLGELKRGDTFAFYANLKDGQGQPLLGAQNKLKSQLRDSNDLLILT